MANLDVGTPRTPAQWREAIKTATFPNTYVQQEYERAGEQIIKGLVDPIVEGSNENLRSMNEEAGELAQRATGELSDRLEALRQQIKKRQISAKDARKERDRIRREEMKLTQLLESITNTYEREIYVRDHAEDVLNSLYERYSALPRPQFPF